MGFLDEYNKALEEEKKKKKKASSNTSTTKKTSSFMDDYRSSLAGMEQVQDEDIAPITRPTTKDEDERKWFEKGAFEDGYQFGDVTKTILGSATDALENIGSGIIGMGETALDALMWLGNAAAKGQYYQNGGGYNIQADRMFEETHAVTTKATEEFIKKDLYDEEKVAKAIIRDPMKALTGIDAERDSVFGEKTDSLVQSGGQLLATAGLQAVGVPWFLTTGATSFGAEAENALNQGASFSEAGLSATISAGAEILTEKLSGGIKFGGKALDEGLTNVIAANISNKLTQKLTKLGLDMVGEGAEEVISQAASNLGSALYKEKDLSEILFSEEAFDGYLESFIGGAALGGLAGGYNSVKSNKNGVDYVTGLNTNEEAVVDKVYKDRLAEAEENGKLSAKEKTKLYDQVINDLDKGYISTDTIEEVLGGETYKTYKDTTDSEEAQIKELEDQLKALEEAPNTVGNSKKYDALTSQLEELKKSSQREGLKNQLGLEVSELVKSDRLAESYNERTRRGQAFEADISKYDEKQQAVIQKAIDSGILNNTNRTHEFVDIVSKISADKGVLFDFTNNAKLKESGFAVDGKQVNGFVTKDGVTLNIDSPKAWQSTVGHEITHVLEGTEMYDALKNTIFEYAKTKGEYDSRLSKLTETYKGVDADIESELAADLVGDYLFQDADFVNHLSTSNRNVFQKIYDEIKYLYKMVTAGSKEARELEKVKRAFDKAYKESAKAQTDTKYSLSNTEGMSEADIDSANKVINNLKTRAMSSKYGSTSYGTYTPERMEREISYASASGIPDYARSYIAWVEPIDFIYATTSSEQARERLKEEAGELDADKLASETQPIYLDVDFETGEIRGHEGRHRMLALKAAGVEKVAVIIDARNDNRYNTKPIDMMRLKGQRFSEYQQGLDFYLHDMLPLSERYADTAREVFTNKPKKGVQFSLSDSDGKQLTQEQQEYFKDSKMRDENGNLKVMYHGSQDAGFHVFDAKMSDDDTSFFFVDRNDVAASYSGTTETYEARTFRTAEEINEFFAEFGNADLMERADSLKKDLDSQYGALLNDLTAYYAANHYDTPEAAAKANLSSKEFAEISIEVGLPSEIASRINAYFELKEEVKKARIEARKADNDIWKYKVVEEDGKFTLLYEGDSVATSDTAEGIYKEFCWYEGVGEGDANYKVYLNLTNPLEVDAQGRNWNNISREYSQEVADRYNSLTADEKAALVDLAEWGDIREFRHELNKALDIVESRGGGDGYTMRLASAYRKLGEDINMYDLFSIAEDNFSEEAINQFAVKQMNTRDYAQKAKAEGYDGVIFKNIVDNGGYSNGSEGASTVAIAFESNQIKSVANTTPTKDADIRYSLSDSEGRQLSEGQAEYFKDSKIRDDNGNLRVMYHGSNDSFTVFDRKKSKSSGFYGSGFYFTNSASHAQHYGNAYSVYLNITNPLQDGTTDITKDQLQKFVEAVAENEDYGIDNYGYGATVSSVVDSVFGKGDFAMLLDINTTCIGNMVEAVELFNEVNGTDYNGIVAPTETVAFYPEQIKSVDNTNPTADKDIRFSLSEPVEQTKDLMALHNLTEQKLLKSLKLGGLPMPSVAIAKAQDGHSEFGEITLVLPREAIDPKESRNNKLYSGDAWTPTYPSVAYKVDGKVLRNISKKLYELVPSDVLHELGRISLDTDNMTDTLNRWGGDVVEAFGNNDALKYAYLVDNGADITLPMKEKRISYGNHENGEIIRVAEAIPADEIKQALNGASAEMRKLEPRVRQAVAEYWQETYGDDPDALELLVPKEELSFSELDSYLSDAMMYHRNGLERTVDSRKAKTVIADQTIQTEYEKWLKQTFSGIVEKEGIRNNKDYFTPSGNRRSFEALHYEHNLENVIKAMREKGEKGIGGFGGGSIFGAATTEFSSVEEMKQSRDRLQTMSEEEYQEMRDEFSNRFFEIAGRLPNDKHSFMATDDAANTLVEAVSKYSTRSGIANYLRRELSGWATYSDQAVDDLIELVRDIRNMPTGYFEAKPQRAVGFDEVGVFVIPNNADVKLKQELLNRGYSIAEYDPNVEGDRQRVVNQFEDLKFSLSDTGDQFKRYGNFATPAKDLRLDIAPVAENATTETSNATQNASDVLSSATVTEVTDLFPDNIAPIEQELERLEAERAQVYSSMESALEVGTAEEVGHLAAEYDSLTARIRELENEISETDRGRVDSLMGEEAPPEMEAPLNIEDAYPSERQSVEDPFEDRDWDEVGNRKKKAYMYENPEVKPFFQEMAGVIGWDLSDTVKAERWYNDELYYESGGEKGYGGNKRHTSRQIATMLDEWGMSYADIEKGLDAIIKDNGAENIAAAKKIEFMLNDMLLHGYKDFHTGKMVAPNQEYINLLGDMQTSVYSKEAFDALMANADDYAPVVVAEKATTTPLAAATPDTMDAPIFESKEQGVVKGQTTMFEPPKPNPKVATVLTEESAIAKEKSGIGSKLVSALVDKGMVFESLSLKTGNRELQAKYNYALPSNTEARAQYLMEHGANGVNSLKDIKTRVERTGKEKAFFDYLYHVHNIDRMTLEDRFPDTPNKPVFGETVTADVSRKKVAKYEKENPWFKEMAQDIYSYNGYLRKMLVDNGVISPETAALWQKMYPHYVPIRRVDSQGQNISVPLDTNKTGVNAPIKRATGGSSDITPLFNTMAQRTEQTYRAIARNAFGIELKNTLGTTIEDSGEMQASVDETIDTLVQQEEKLLKPGTMFSSPTFTVFENGERVEFEITEDMYEALKPAGKLLGYRNQAVKKMGDARRNLLTVWNPVFALYRNPIKDIQDVAINSQHAAKTYMNVPNAIYQLATGGKYATEYHKNGGKSNTYFDGRTNKFKAEDNVFKKVIGMPVRAIETAGEFVEEIPRLAEYIASRQEGRSVERSMLDASRVTTNFAAGGDFTKFLNSHGFTFLNASVQGASQHVRNFREAKQQGLKGWLKVAAKYAVAGLPTVLLNGMLWDDDEEYTELSDYVKQNYYVVAKTQDGKFVRIPKGRTAAVMGELFRQMENLVTGDDEADFSTFFDLFMDNIAPNNPLDNNILAPVIQTMTNKAWYGDDIVPSRLQDVPDEEQYDESTDSISKWLGEATGTSPYKWNYLIDQYSGGLGDVFLPMLTPEAESGDNSLLGNFLAPWKKEVTTDMVLNNKYPGDFYDLRDELEKKANSSKATEEDAMRSMFMDAVSWDMSDLYQQKREIQNSDMSDTEKYEAVREIQEQINALAENAMNGYNDVSISGLYAEVGDRRFNMDSESGKWYEIQETNADGSANYYYEMEQKVTQALGIGYEEYWNNREEYNYAYEKPEQYTLSQAVGGYEAYRGYLSELWDISADKDENGKSISGSRKEKVIDYLNNLDCDYYTKIILFKNEYNADDTYNYEIIDHLNSREDISYEEMETILKYLGFEVDSNGNISW